MTAKNVLCSDGLTRGQEETQSLHCTENAVTLVIGAFHKTQKSIMGCDNRQFLIHAAPFPRFTSRDPRTAYLSRDNTTQWEER